MQQWDTDVIVLPMGCSEGFCCGLQSWLLQVTHYNHVFENVSSTWSLVFINSNNNN